MPPQNCTIVNSTISRIPSWRFQGLPLDDELARRKAHPWCGVFVIDLRSGHLAEWIRMSGEYTELVDVALIPNVRCPMALEPDSPQMQDAITFEDEGGEARAEYEGSASGTPAANTIGLR